MITLIEDYKILTEHFRKFAIKYGMPESQAQIVLNGIDLAVKKMLIKEKHKSNAEGYWNGWTDRDQQLQQPRYGRV